MGIKFGKFILDSNNPARLYHFLSFIFDVEADSKQESNIIFEFEQLCFLLKRTTNEIPRKCDFTIEVDDKSELMQFSQSVEFYYYKECIKIFYLKLEDNQLSFSDPDGRLWVIEYRASLYPLNPDSEYIQTNNFS